MPPDVPVNWPPLITSAAIAAAVLALIYAGIVGVRYRSLKKALKTRLKRQRNEDRARHRSLLALRHDLRQPLQAAAMFGEVLSKRLEGTPNAAIVDRLTQAIEATGSLLSSMTDVSKMELGQIEISTMPVALAPFLERIFLQMEPLAQSKSLRYLLFTRDVTIQTDPLLLARLVRNLVNNAISYTNAGGVLLGCRHRPGQVGIQVVDTGIGIDRSHLDLIFEDFVRLASVSQDDDHGLGLGAVQRIARLLGHDIEVKSSPGNGSRFTVWVDLAKEPDRD